MLLSIIFTILIALLIISVLVIAGIFVLRAYLRNKSESLPKYKDTIFLIRVPKQSAKIEEEREKGSSSGSIEGMREKIAIMQMLYANVSGLKQQGWLSRFFYGQQSYISLEIVVKKGLIHFYVICPFLVKEFVAQQIHAQFPDAEVTEETDYNIFTEHGQASGAYLRFRRTSILPIKTYKELDSDPLRALTNALSKVDIHDGVAVQILARPQSKSWARRSRKIASAMQQGKSFEKARGEGINPTRLLQHGAYEALTAPLESTKKKSESDNNTNSLKQRSDYRLSPLEEDIVKGIENKSSQATYAVTIRIIASSEAPGRTDTLITNVANSFAQYDYGQRGNGFRLWKPRFSNRLVSDFIFRRFFRRAIIVLSAEELSSIWHVPLPSTETPNILWLSAKRAAPPINAPDQGVILGKSTYRGEERIIRIKTPDRRRHLYIIGKSGGGKSVLISNLAIQDIKNGDGVCLLDPHGDLVESVLEHIPKERVDDVIVFDPSDVERPLGLNMLEFKTEEQKDFVVQEMIAIFYKLFPPEMIGPMFEHNMRNVMLTLMADKDYPGTIADIPRMFTDKEYQKYKINKLHDPVVRAFWEKEMAQTTDFHKSEMLGYLISKVGRFVENEMMRNIIGQSKSGFDFREVMDQKKILLVNLSKGKTGEVNSSLLGLIIVSKLQMAALGRAELPEHERNDFYVYIDEFQNFITDSIATILSEARKYRLDLILAHQYLGQLRDDKGQHKILDAVLGNVGTMVVFRVGVEDAETIAKELAPIFNEYDVVNIEQYRTYVKLLIDNTAAPAFDMETFPPQPGRIDLATSIKELSRLKYARPRYEVQAEIMERTQLGVAATKADFRAVEASL